MRASDIFAIAISLDQQLGADICDKFTSADDRGAIGWKPQNETERAESLVWDARCKLYSAAMFLDD